jgi:hypothetical protein
LYISYRGIICSRYNNALSILYESLSVVAKVLAHHCFNYYDLNNPFYIWSSWQWQHDDGARIALRLAFLCNNALFPMRAPVIIAFTLSVARTLNNWRLVNLCSVATHGHIPSISFVCISISSSCLFLSWGIFWDELDLACFSQKGNGKYLELVWKIQ